MNTVNIGDIGEAVAIFKFTCSGFVVSKPLSNNCRYDLIVEYNNKLYKIQVKTTSNVKDDVMVFATKTTNYTKGTWSSNNYTKQDIDAFFLYCEENQWCGLYFGEEDSSFNKNLNIRIAPTKTGRTKGIRFADEYSFEKQIEKLFNLSNQGSNP